MSLPCSDSKTLNSVSDHHREPYALVLKERDWRNFVSNRESKDFFNKQTAFLHHYVSVVLLL